MRHHLDRDDRDPGCAAVTEAAAAYVLGALEAGEMAAVRRHLGACAEAHAEFAELGGVVPYLADLVDAEEPSPALRERIIAAVTADARATARDEQAAERLITAIGMQGRGEAVREVRAIPIEAAAPRPARPAVVPDEAPPVIPASVVSRPIVPRPAVAWAAAAAAVLLVVVLGTWNLSLRSEVDRQADFVAWQARVLDEAAIPGHRLAVLHDDAPRASGVAAVAADGTVMLAAHGLRPTVGDEVYETWVIADDGSPVPIGSFTVDASGTGRLEADGAPTGERLVVALTREPGPGATIPSLPLVARGTATQVVD